MTSYATDDLRIVKIKEVAAPEKVHAAFPISEEASRTVFETRQAIHNILAHKDDRMVIIVGPCSVHDTKAALEYAEKLAPLQEELKDDLLIIMRVYFEKPRTTVGWKGLINDPFLDDSFHINKGLHVARELLLNLNNMGMPTATEFLDLISPQYIADLIAWGAIGARTTESQGHRELASGLSCPVGFKNGTDGRLQIAIDAIRSASNPHSFMSLTKEGHSAIFSTSGNEDCHVILRGGSRPNYDAESIEEAAQDLEKAGLTPNLMVDFSHANSKKQHERQVDVGNDVAGQVSRGDKRIIGAMIESHLVGGRQDHKPDVELIYGQSITDACLAWDDTKPLLYTLAEAVRERRNV
ncbi:3-deoxy-7-phosphoheptulonate synthase AroG [Solemya velum gill symbiont]|uniref:Phospho-2-dehydro-3-deoxyheptonate aldolase n=1 Tax=Solemya velum gill symbiont TaxID=2340 RepID=A0A0B0H7R2_SOVGS|nr:3-deoxy-7-phosphoheptulonate synthase AroG [Solemya velum gill symbiont]KHF25160.1 3-deoxy-D-arabinoheptulosonate-7-phosphate synthase [Solemya velum gill symbiont]OOY34880.1 3-deoxy-7-phosphoheptulonate synthase [Solemya velum gill symbiont]OOY37595.1 3-deoxy-7-phosphoheptulonate synthase [Solemya velum gill symbiont]OOY40638.1 3-deoxy-7-phosphoheptulonate synthase [Solemya velum gill symbiont]OOY44259.1 3-deoxy-7-phosphoheptulonate synthase [Solemya velum gill symbiont]